MNRLLSAGAISLFIALAAFGSEPAPESPPRLLVVRDGNVVDTINAWRAIVCEEFAVIPVSTSGDTISTRPVGPRVAVSALASNGVIAQLDDLGYMFPQAGWYVLRNGQVIRANPLALSALNRTHRLLEIDHRGVVLRRANEADIGSLPVPAQTALRVAAESRTLRMVLGQSQEALLSWPLSDAELVVFEPALMSRALGDLNRIRAGAPLVNRPAANVGNPREKTDRERNRS